MKSQTRQGRREPGGDLCHEPRRVSAKAGLGLELVHFRGRNLLGVAPSFAFFRDGCRAVEFSLSDMTHVRPQTITGVIFYHSRGPLQQLIYGVPTRELLP
jgi:hypothetical protein